MVLDKARERCERAVGQLQGALARQTVAAGLKSPSRRDSTALSQEGGSVPPDPGLARIGDPHVRPLWPFSHHLSGEAGDGHLYPGMEGDGSNNGQLGSNNGQIGANNGQLGSNNGQLGAVGLLVEKEFGTGAFFVKRVEEGSEAGLWRDVRGETIHIGDRS